MRLYRRHGFKIVARLKKELLINGRFHDEVIMEKFL
jgi:RimJ/RimL family protein N-acetyltransferase